MADTAGAQNRASLSPKSAESSPKGASPPTGGGDLETAAAQLEADEDGSVIGEDAASDTTSLASSVLDYRREHGRTYHAYKAGTYFLPNDETENNRLDLQHNICILTLDNQLFISPAGKDKPLRRVLDAGCGTGIWSIDFADEHPEVSVCGVDLSPIQPEFVPPNVEYFVDDLEADWTFVQPFDLIYMRLLTGSIKDWPRLFKQAFAHLAPGGYIELFDTLNPLTSDDGTLTPDAPVLRWNQLLLEASRRMGRPLDSVAGYKELLQEAGFVDVVQKEYKWPVNPWPKDKKHKNLGAWTAENFSQGLQAISLMLFTNVMGWSVEEVEVFLVDVRKDVRDRNIHSYWPVYVVYGKKPDV